MGKVHHLSCISDMNFIIMDKICGFSLRLPEKSIFDLMAALKQRFFSEYNKYLGSTTLAQS